MRRDEARCDTPGPPRLGMSRYDRVSRRYIAVHLELFLFAPGRSLEVSDSPPEAPPLQLAAPSAPPQPSPKASPSTERDVRRTRSRSASALARCFASSASRFSAPALGCDG